MGARVPAGSPDAPRLKIVARGGAEGGESRAAAAQPGRQIRYDDGPSPSQMSADNGSDRVIGGQSGQQPSTRSAADAETTIALIERVKQGDSAATDALFRRCLPVLRRWARGRLPAYARDLKETQDIVQECLVEAFKHLPQFDTRGEGALQAYLRQAVANRIRNEIKRVVHRPVSVELDDCHPDRGVGPLEAAIGNQNIERYEAALQRLRPADRELIVGRLEMQWSYEELAKATGKPSANAARVAAIRAVYRLVEEIQHES
jgi:RNA polymerase sigma factor (sigma-70 family)